jgi:cytoskeletal protein CcmA (bactofilin family)
MWRPGRPFGDEIGSARKLIPGQTLLSSSKPHPRGRPVRHFTASLRSLTKADAAAFTAPMIQVEQALAKRLNKQHIVDRPCLRRGKGGEMGVLESECGENGKCGNGGGQTADQAAGSKAAVTEDNTAIRPNQLEALSVGTDGNCCVLKSSNFSGQLHFEGAARIECRVASEIHGTGAITVAPSAVVMGPIRAASVLVEGRVSADITASERIEIRPSAIVSGNLIAPSMIVHEKAQVEGRFTMARVRSAALLSR